MQSMYLTFNQVSTIPHKETVHVRDSQRSIGFIEYHKSRPFKNRSEGSDWLLILPGVQQRFNTIHQAREFAKQHIERVYSKQDCEN